MKVVARVEVKSIRGDGKIKPGLGVSGPGVPKRYCKWARQSRRDAARQQRYFVGTNFRAAEFMQ